MTGPVRPPEELAAGTAADRRAQLEDGLSRPGLRALRWPGPGEEAQPGAHEHPSGPPTRRGGARRTRSGRAAAPAAQRGRRGGGRLAGGAGGPARAAALPRGALAVGGPRVGAPRWLTSTGCGSAR